MNAVSTAEADSIHAQDATYQWSDSLLTGDARMDETHREFADQLGALLATPVSEQLPLYQEFIAHTVAHFAQEDRWMQATGFTASNCHTDQHAMILETMQAVVQHYQKGEADIINRMGEALAEWFDQHATSMDAGLAQHLQSVGFDSATETLANPAAVRNVTVSGCGSVSHG
ncbi:MAG: hemerythrin domain-containing protein [Rhodoferax sp.]|nr:hemerythrin domain-containing protein [Rhodoferax sp.]